MSSKTMQIKARLEVNQAEWFKQRMADSGKTQSELLRELISDRIDLEANPWRFIGRKMKDTKRVVVQGQPYNTLIPDFAKSKNTPEVKP